MAANTGVVIQQIMLEGLQNLAEVAEKRVRKPTTHNARQPVVLPHTQFIQTC